MLKEVRLGGFIQSLGTISQEILFAGVTKAKQFRVNGPTYTPCNAILDPKTCGFHPAIVHETCNLPKMGDDKAN